jgi:hypothetical protein
MSQIKDGCIFVRDVYNGLLKLCGTNKWVASFLFGSPVYWTIGAIIIYSPEWNENDRKRAYYKNLISSPVYTILSILSLAWLLAIFAVLRFWPNLVSISVFIYEAFGHWCLVTLAVLAYVQGGPATCGLASPTSGYQVSDEELKKALIKMYFAFIAMPVFLLLLSAEILRTHRSKMFSHNVSQDRMMENTAASSSSHQVPSDL